MPVGGSRFWEMPVTQRCRTCESAFSGCPTHTHTKSTDLSSRAQGAAQAVEDGAVLGELFARIERKAQIPVALSCYEELRKKRTTRVVQESAALRDTFHLENGERQRERDRQLREDEPFEGFPHRWADPCFQKWLFGYDAFGEVEKVWPGRKSLSGNSSQIDITNDAYGKAICERC